MPQSLLYLILNPLEHYKMDYQEQFFKQLYKQIIKKLQLILTYFQQFNFIYKATQLNPEPLKSTTVPIETSPLAVQPSPVKLIQSVK